MKKRTGILDEFRSVPEGELIISGKLYREKFADCMGEAAYAQSVSRLCRAGEIERVSKGIYCRPQKTRFGVIIPSDRGIAESFAVGRNGMLIGYALYNFLGISTQISKKYDVYSALSEERLKQIGNVTIHRYELDYTSTVKNVIAMMELLYHYAEIQDLNHVVFLQILQQLAESYDEQVFDMVQNVIGYPKWTIAFLREVLDHKNIQHNLVKRLSAFTKYSITSMEELYETARKQN